MYGKKMIRSLAVVAAIAIAPLAAQAQFGGLLGGAKAGGGASPDQVEKHIKDYFSGINRTNRLLGEALNLDGLAQAAKEKADCTESGSCGLKDGASLAKGHSEEIAKKIRELQAAGTKLTEEQSVKITRSFEGVGKAALAAKNALTDGKNMDKGMKALTLAALLPDIGNSFKATFDAGNAVVSYMRFSGVKTDDLVKNLSSAVTESGIPGISANFGN